jgi:hypothetical protein
MIFQMRWASNWKREEEVSLFTLEDLLALVKKEGDIIVKDDGTLVAYDDYMD